MTKVLEIGGYSAGYFGRLFADQGAEILRIDCNTQTPAWASEQAMSAFLHSNKNYVTGADQQDIRRLADQADVVVCGVDTAAELEQLGFDHWNTKVKVAITPFGKTGPKRNWQATPSTLLAMGGYTHLIGDPGRAPLTLPGHYLEFQTAAIAYSAAAACLHANLSDVIDISMLETVLSLTQFTSVRWHCAGEIRERHGSDFYFVVPSNLFLTQDKGWVYINIVPTFWDAFTLFVDLPELLIDERYTTNDLRIANREQLYEATANVIKTLSVDECVQRAEASRIPLGVVQSFEDVLNDPHLAVRNFWRDLEIGDNTVKIPRGGFQIHAQETKALTPEIAVSSTNFSGNI
jgi:crotonobetainyl-CoA:carnitine CoA-transferase CaiB-like acyl-CoA transferase